MISIPRIRAGSRRKAAPVATAAALMLAVGGYGVFATSQHEDEDLYVWASQYLVHQIATLDVEFEADPLDPYSRAHWDPDSNWAQGMGTSTRLVYGLGLVLTPRTHAPELPYSGSASRFQGPKTVVDLRTLRVMRFIAVLCAAIGIALVALRFGWAAVLGAVVILGVPGGIATFSRAWAEGPLLLGLGLCAIAFGTRWFSPALGLGVTFKLTALGLWPLVLLRRARVVKLWHGLVAMVGVFLVLNPPSWAMLGPLYLIRLMRYRQAAWTDQSSEGLFLPSRYFWPFELAAVIGGVWIVTRIAAHYRQTRGRRVTDSTTRTPVIDG